MNLYVFKDIKANSASMPVFAFSNDAVAVRSLQMVIPADHLARRFPEDFQIWRLGTFDQVTLELVPDLTFVINCSELFAPAEVKDVSHA